MGNVSKIRVNRPGTYREHWNAVVAQLDAQRFGETCDVGFRRRIDREVGDRQQAGQRAHVDHRSTSTGHHAG